MPFPQTTFVGFIHDFSPVTRLYTALGLPVLYFYKNPDMGKVSSRILKQYSFSIKAILAYYITQEFYLYTYVGIWNMCGVILLRCCHLTKILYYEFHLMLPTEVRPASFRRSANRKFRM